MSETDNIGVKARESVIVGTAHLWVRRGEGYVDACGSLGESHESAPAHKNIMLIEAKDAPCSQCLEVMTYDDPEDRAPEYISPEDREVAEVVASYAAPSGPEEHQEYHEPTPDVQQVAEVPEQAYVERPSPVAGLGDYGVDVQQPAGQFFPQEPGVFYPTPAHD